MFAACLTGAVNKNQYYRCVYNGTEDKEIPIKKINERGRRNVTEKTYLNRIEKKGHDEKKDVRSSPFISRNL